MNIIDKLILLSFPFMDVGFVIYGTPLRIGELVFILSILRIINSQSVLKITRVHKLGLSIISLVFINMIVFSVAGIFSKIDLTFYLKYFLRNFIYFFVMISFLLKPIDYNYINATGFIKYILYVVSFFYLIEFIDYYIINFGWQDLAFVRRQSKTVFKGFMIKFAGPSSEPAYIIPLLSIPLMYGLFAKKLEYSVVSLIYMLLSFSSFGYAVIVFAIIFFIKNTNNKKVRKRVFIFLQNFLVSIFVLSLIFIDKISILLTHNWEKFKTYFGIGSSNEWSASQRANHMGFAFDLFKDATPIRKFFGSGTGHYSKVSKEFTKFYLDDAEEAHNLYVSTLLDRGIIGFTVLLLLFYFIGRIKIPKNTSVETLKCLFIAIKFGAFVRMFHWAFTGTLWQYYFWVEVSLLISASAYYIKISNDKQ